MRPSIPIKHYPSIAIVGAGIAGLRCASLLIQSGIKNVTIFEARNRIGGRLHQCQIPIPNSSSTGNKNLGYLVDMGPNWIHGTNGNSIMKLAERTGTVLLAPEEDAGQAVFDSDGHRKSDEEAKFLGETVWGAVVEAFRYSEENSDKIDKDKSLYEFFEERFQQRFGSEDRGQEKVADLLKEAQMWGPFVGDPVEKQSLKFFFLEECIDGENVFVANTYNDILDEIGRVALEKAKVRFNEEVIGIEILDNKSKNKNMVNERDSSSLETGVQLTTRRREKHTFDEVILTTPLGWLKRNKSTAFTPPLPDRLNEAIDNINYGRLEKLHVTFPSAFWLESSSADTDTNSSTTTSTSTSTTSTYPIFTHYHAPTYHPTPSSKTLPSTWNQNLMTLSHLPAPHSHPTLLFYIYGDCATNLVDSLTNPANDNHLPLTPHSSAYNKTLDTFAEPFYTLLPNYHPENPACHPVAFLATTWQADPFAGNGSYCNFQVGLEKGDEDIRVMREAGGLNGRGLWLAGEHTAPFVALGTTTGAWWSGEGVARGVCRKWGIEVFEDDLVMRVTKEEKGSGIDGEGSGVYVKKKEMDVGKKADGANLAGLAI